MGRCVLLQLVLICETQLPHTCRGWKCLNGAADVSLGHWVAGFRGLDQNIVPSVRWSCCMPSNSRLLSSCVRLTSPPSANKSWGPSNIWLSSKNANESFTAFALFFVEILRLLADLSALMFGDGASVNQLMMWHGHVGGAVVNSWCAARGVGEIVQHAWQASAAEAENWGPHPHTEWRLANLAHKRAGSPLTLRRTLSLSGDQLGTSRHHYEHQLSVKWWLIPTARTGAQWSAPCASVDPAEEPTLCAPNLWSGSLRRRGITTAAPQLCGLCVVWLFGWLISWLVGFGSVWADAVPLGLTAPTPRWPVFDVLNKTPGCCDAQLSVVLSWKPGKRARHTYAWSCKIWCRKPAAVTFWASTALWGHPRSWSPHSCTSRTSTWTSSRQMSSMTLPSFPLQPQSCSCQRRGVGAGTGNVSLIDDCCRSCWLLVARVCGPLCHLRRRCRKRSARWCPLGGGTPWVARAGQGALPCALPGPAASVPARCVRISEGPKTPKPLKYERNFIIIKIINSYLGTEII